MTHKDLIKHFFINEWFPNADKMVNDSYFLSNCAEDAEFIIDGKLFVGHAGFIEWMKGPRSTLKPNIMHNVESIEVNCVEGNLFDVHLIVSVKATTLTDEPISFRAKDTWKVSVSEENKIIINGRLAKTIS